MARETTLGRWWKLKFGILWDLFDISVEESLQGAVETFAAVAFEFIILIRFEERFHIKIPSVKIICGLKVRFQI